MKKVFSALLFCALLAGMVQIRIEAKSGTTASIVETYSELKQEEEIQLLSEEEQEDVSITDSGTCGDALTWTLDSKGVLTILGTGEMTNFSSSSARPWYSYRTSITEVVIYDGVTSIGNYAFRDCSNLVAIDISTGIVSIGSYAFYNCSSLTNIIIPEGITSIGNYVFSGCSSLANIAIPEGVTSIGNYAFYNCESLINVKIPEGVISIENYVFYNCKSMTKIEIPESLNSVERSAFYNCDSLSEIYYNGGQRTWNKLSLRCTNASGNDSFLNAEVYLGREDEIQFDGGNGTEESPYLLSTAEQLNVVREDLMAHYVQMSDIEYAGEVFEPIGNYSTSDDKNSFVGSFDGNGYYIKDLVISSISQKNVYVGLFAYNEGSLKNINLIDLKMKILIGSKFFEEGWSNPNIGGIAGHSTGDMDKIYNCSVSGEISVIWNAEKETKGMATVIVGGVLGKGNCSNCINYASVDVCRTSDSESKDQLKIECGGIVGHAGAVFGKISNCINYGNVEASANEFVICGGISGHYGTFEKCVNFGNIYSDVTDYISFTSGYVQSNAGGISGACTAYSITDCINFGNISSTRSCDFGGCCAGGIVGYLSHNSSDSMSNCYNLGTWMKGDTTEDEDDGDIDSYDYHYAGRIYGRESLKITDCYSIDTTVVSGGMYSEEDDIDHPEKHGTSMSKNEICTAIAGILESLRLSIDIVDNYAFEDMEVRYLREWDSEKQIAYWGQTDYVGSQVTEETDTSFLENINNLIGEYVLVETKKREDADIAPNTIISIKPVETKTGTVTAADDTNIIIDDNSYDTPDNLIYPDGYANDFVLYHLYEGTLVGIETLETEKGTLSRWNSETREIVINPEEVNETITTYYLSILAAEETIVLLGDSGEKNSTLIEYITDRNKLVYHVEYISVDEGDNEDSFIIGRDTNSFCHDSEDFGYIVSGTKVKKKQNDTKGDIYPTSETYYGRLIENMTDGEEDELLDMMYNGIDGSWVGSCFGLSLSMYWANVGKANVSSFYNSGENIYEKEPTSYSDLIAPGIDLDLRDYINYCHLLQKTNKLDYEIVSSNKYLDLSHFFGANKKWENFWNEIFDLVDAGNTALLSYYYRLDGDGKGHAVVVGGAEYDSSTSEYMRFKIYDCNVVGINSVDSSVPLDFLYLYVNPNDYGEFYFTQSNGEPCIYTYGDDIYSYVHINRNNWDNFKYWNVDGVDASIEIASDINGTEKNSVMSLNDDLSTQESTVKFMVEAGKQFYLEASDGSYLTYDGTSYSGNMTVYDMNIVGEEKCEIWFVVDASSEFTVTNINDSCAYAICTDEIYYKASAENADSIVFEIGKGIDFKGEDYTFSACLSLQSEAGTLHVNGTCSKDSSISYGDIGMNIDTSGMFTNVETIKITVDDKEQKEIAGTFDSANIDEKGDVSVSRVDTEHNYVWIVDKQATTTETGFKHEECTICGEKRKENTVIEKLVDSSENTTEQGVTYPAKGTSITDTKSKAKFVVTEEGSTVAYAGTTNKKATSITIPTTVTIDSVTYTVTSIAKNAFKNNKKITKVTIGNSITSIGASAFQNCTALKTVKMGSGVTTIGSKAFYGCKKLTSLTIGKNVTSIGTSAFQNCTSLKKVTIPSKVKKIGAKAFYGCKKLTNITIKTTKLTTKNVGKQAFTKAGSSNYKKLTVKVPKKKLKAYKSMLKKKGLSKKAKVKK